MDDYGSYINQSIKMAGMIIIQVDHGHMSSYLPLGHRGCMCMFYHWPFPCQSKICGILFWHYQYPPLSHIIFFWYWNTTVLFLLSWDKYNSHAFPYTYIHIMNLNKQVRWLIVWCQSEIIYQPNLLNSTINPFGMEDNLWI